MLFWFGYSALSDAAITVAMVEVMTMAFPVLGASIPRAVFIIALFMFLTVVNVRGVEAGVRLYMFNTLAKLIPLLLLLVAWTVRAAEAVVILLSWDGVRHDMPDRARTPALDRVAQSGTHAALRPVFPTNTFPNHVSLATGTFVDRHGIVGNVFEDRERGRYRYSNDASWIEAEPIWAAAERQGVRAASFFWVGSETDWRGRGASYRRAPFDTKIGEDEKVDQILAWLDLPAAERPGLIVSWWHGADHAGHERGPDHADVVRALERQDVQLLRLLEGLDVRGAWDETTLIIVSDHGMS